MEMVWLNVIVAEYTHKNIFQLPWEITLIYD